MHCVYNLVFHDILQAAIKNNLDEAHIWIFRISCFHLFLTGLCCCYESKKLRCLKWITSARRFWILSLYINNKSWLNVAHALTIANNQFLPLIVLNNSWILKRAFVDWAFYNFIIQKKNVSVKHNINNYVLTIYDPFYFRMILAK